MLWTFFSPKHWRPLPWPSETRPTGTGFSAEIASSPPEPRLWGSARLLAQAICPKHVHSHSKDVSAARECCKFLSCRILSTQTAMGYPPARVLNQVLSSSSLGESFRCRVWLNWQLGQRSQLLKCKCIQQGGEKKPSRTNPPRSLPSCRQVQLERKASSVSSTLRKHMWAYIS